MATDEQKDVSYAPNIVSALNALSEVSTRVSWHLSTELPEWGSATSFETHSRRQSSKYEWKISSEWCRWSVTLKFACTFHALDSERGNKIIFCTSLINSCAYALLRLPVPTCLKLQKASNWWSIVLLSVLRMLRMLLNQPSRRSLIWLKNK